MKTNDFMNLRGIKKGDEVTVDALALQQHLIELSKLQDVEVNLTSSKRLNNELQYEVDDLKNEINVLKQKLEDCLNHNDTLYEDNINKASLIRTYKKQMGEISDISSNNERLKREHKQMREKLALSSALLQYRSNERRYSHDSNMRVDLNRY